MTVFFLASIQGLEKYSENFQSIITITEQLGHKVLATHVLSSKVKDIEETPSKNLKEKFNTLVKKMKNSDAVIFEGSQTTTGGGYFIATAIQNHIPVLFLKQNRYTGLMLRDSNRIMQMKTYSSNDKKELKKIIENFLTFAKGKKLHIRFNLMIDDSISNHLDYMSKEHDMSKSDYMRSLVYNDINKQKK